MVRKLLICFVLVFAFVGTAQAVIFSDGFESGDFSAWKGWSQVPGYDPVLMTSTTVPTTVWWAGGTIANDSYAGSYSADFVAGAWWSTGGGCFEGLLGDFGGKAFSMTAYAKVVSFLEWNPGGIDMVFYAGIPDETVNGPPSLGRCDLLLTGAVTDNTGTATGSLGAPDINGWMYAVLNCVAPVGTTYMKFEIEGMCSGSNSGEVRFDNVVGAPEPATMVLLGLGSLALLKRRKS